MIEREALPEVSAVQKYTRVVATDDGGSAFEDGELRFQEVRMGEGAPPMFVSTLDSVQGAAVVRFASFHGEPHPADAPQWVVVVRGVIEVEVTDGTCRQFGPGDVCLASDTSGRGHITRVIGDTPVEALGIACATAS